MKESLQRLAICAVLAMTLGSSAMAQRYERHRIWYNGGWVYRSTYWMNHHYGWSYDSPDVGIYVGTGPFHVYYNNGWVDHDRIWLRRHRGWYWHHPG